MRILIGYNGTDLARGAIEELVHAGLPDEIEAQVVTVAELCFPTVPQTAAQAVADEGVGLVRDIFPSWDVLGSSTTGEPVHKLITTAQSFRPDLIVLGGSNKRLDRAEKLAPGSVVKGLLEISQIPLRICRRKERPPGRSARLIIGFDGSPDSKKAVTVIARRRWSPGTLVRVISIEVSGLLESIESFPPHLRAAAIGSGFASKWAETLVSWAIGELNRAGVDAELETRMGQPQNVLSEAADEWDADCIFVPFASGGSFADRISPESLPAAVAAHANCTVEVMR